MWAMASSCVSFLPPHRKDPNEWTNVAANPEYAKVIAEHQRFIPKVNRKPAPGSKHRILTYIDGKVVWQGEEVKADDPIPGWDGK